MKHLSLLASLGMMILLTGCESVTTTTKTTGGASQNLEPNYIQAYQNYLQLGATYVRNGRYDLAEPKLKRAIEIDSKPPEAWNILAILYEQKRDIASGNQVYQKLITSHPDYALGFMNYATFLCKFDRTSDMQALLSKMRTRSSDFVALSYIAEGNCALEKQQTTHAKTAFREALNYDNHAAGALVPLADLELKQGNAQGALNYIKVVHTYVGYTSESVRIGILAARQTGNSTLEDELMRVMRASYQGSEQAKALGI